MEFYAEMPQITQKCLNITLLMAKRGHFCQILQRQHLTTGCWFLLDYSLTCHWHSDLIDFHTFSFSVIVFSAEILFLRYRTVPSAIWQIFYELLATWKITAKHKKWAWNICQFCMRLLCDNQFIISTQKYYARNVM